jgi:hypothetical protein
MIQIHTAADCVEAMLTPRNKTRYNWGRYKEERETDELDAPEYQFTAAEQCGGAMREY